LITVDTKEFEKSWGKLSKKAIPEAFVKGVSETAKKANISVIRHTRSVFKLHSDYILKGIKYRPATVSQIKASIGKLKKSYNFHASVYVRGAKTEKRSLSFLVDHELGGTRKPEDGSHIAIPGDVRRYSYKTARGKVYKRWNPETLLEYFNKYGISSRSRKRQRSKPKPFIMKASSGIYIVRNKAKKSRDIEFLYKLQSQVRIQKRWDFIKTVHSNVSMNLFQDINRQIINIRGL